MDRRAIQTKGWGDIVIRVRSALVLVVAVLGCGRAAQPSAAPTIPPADSTFTADVSPRLARFSFPLAEHDEWFWHRSTTRSGMGEYSWTVNVENAGQRYSFGFLLFKPTNARPARGKLTSLLRAGQQSVGIGSGTQFELSDELKVKVTAQGNRLHVDISDPKTLQALFSGRPERSVFTVVLPGESARKREVAIRYQP
jgi:hypothetical protein